MIVNKYEYCYHLIIINLILIVRVFLMGIPSDFPCIFKNYQGAITYSDEEEKQCLIEAVAERLSSIYAAFLTAQGHEKRNEKLRFSFFPKNSLLQKL